MYATKFKDLSIYITKSQFPYFVGIVCRLNICKREHKTSITLLLINGKATSLKVEILILRYTVHMIKVATHETTTLY